MTSPEDNGLEEALRRALSEAASEVEPGKDGLDKIRVRIADRPPRPWLLSVLFGAADRVRNWTWRGHWARPAWLSRLAKVRWPRLRRGSFPRRGSWPLRLATVFAGIAVLASITLGVQPFRNAILQASTALQGGGSRSPRTAAGTESSGTRTVEGGSVTPSAGATPGGQSGTGSSSSASGDSDDAKSHSSAAKCQASALPVVTGTKPSLTDVRSTASATATATGTPSPVISTRAPAQPVYTEISAVTCPVTAPTQSPTPTTAAPTPVSTPTPTPAASDPAPTADPSPTGHGWPAPSGPPSWPRLAERHWDWHPHSRWR